MRNLTFTHYKDKRVSPCCRRFFIGLVTFCMFIGTATLHAQAPCDNFFDVLDGTGANPVVGGDNTDVEDAINARNYEVNGSVMTVNSASFNGGATIDEEIINNSQQTGYIGLRTGVDHPEILGGIGGANMTRSITFDPPVSNLEMLFNDIDNNDIAIINPKLNGLVQSAVAGITSTGSNVLTINDNQFDSGTDAALGPSLDGSIFFNFAGPLDEVEIIFYDDQTAPGVPGTEGGSYTIDFLNVCPPAEFRDPCDVRTGFDASSIGGPYYYWEDENGDPVDLPTVCTDRNWGDFSGLNGAGANPVVGADNTVVEDAINGQNYTIKGATLTVNQATFNGGSFIDEEIVDDSQLNGTFALRTGVNHDQIVGGAAAANITRVFTFDRPVCGLAMLLNDLDNNDVAIINASNAGANVPLTAADVLSTGANVTTVGTSQFESITDSGLNNSAAGSINFEFQNCIDRIEIIFYDDAAGPGVVGTEGGSYSVNFPAECDYPSSQDELPEGCYTVYVKDENGAEVTEDFCIESKGCSAIGNYVWVDENEDGLQDRGEVGIPNVTVTLEDADGNTVTTKTDAHGGYLFPDLPGGTYTVTVDESTLPRGMAQTTLINPGADFGNQANTGYMLFVGKNDENMTADFGYAWGSPDGNSGLAAIGDRVWHDGNADGVQDAGEPGIDGVTLTIYSDSNDDGIIDPVSDVPYAAAIDQDGNTGTGTTMTEPDGKYIFYNLPADQYIIIVDPNSAGIQSKDQTGDPDEYGRPATNPDNMSEPILVAPGDLVINIDFGYINPGDNNDIGDTVYFDRDGDGSQNGGDLGIEGVTLALTDAAGNILATTRTDENGNYLFTGLPDKAYMVLVTDTENILAGLDNSGDPDGGNDDKSSVATLPSDNLDQDFGYTPRGQEPIDGLIGDKVFLDYNNNGTPDRGEGIEGVTLELKNTGGEVIFTTKTDENGMYYFGDLPEGNYTVDVIENTLPPGITNTVDPDGGTPGESNTSLPLGGEDLAQDFGYVPAVAGSIGTRVWEDHNADGIDDGVNGPDGIAGTDDDEPGLAGVTIDLYLDGNSNGQLDPGERLLASTITDADGNYLFPNLPANDVDYLVDVTDKQEELEGYWHSRGAQGQATDLNSKDDAYLVNLGGGANPADVITADFGYYIDPACIGGIVWAEQEEDGIQNLAAADESPVPGIEVQLEITYPDGTVTTLTDITRNDGSYFFCGLLVDEDFRGDAAGEPTYIVSVGDALVQGQQALGGNFLPVTALNVAGSDLLDADDPKGVQAFPTQGLTNIIPAASGADEPVHLSYDFAYTPTLPLELMYFKGIEESCVATLTWATATEENTSHFNIQKSTSGLGFVTIDRVEAAGNTNTQMNYSSIDETPTTDNYYRLEMVDIDGPTTYSDIIHLSTDCNVGTTVISDVYPNPTDKQLSIRFNSGLGQQNADVLVTDALGRTVMVEPITVNEGLNVIDVDVSHLVQASYFLVIKGENAWFTNAVQFVKLAE